MTGFVAIRWDVADALASAVAARLRAFANRADHETTILIDRSGWFVAGEIAGDSQTKRLLADGRGVVLGTLFDRADIGRNADDGSRFGAAPKQGGDGFEAFCRRLRDQNWGAYVSLWSDPEIPSAIAIFRDPIGMLDCATWLHHGVRIVSDDTRWIEHAPPEGLGIDWQRLAQILIQPANGADESPLLGIDVVPTGTLVRYDGRDRHAERLWHPRDLCCRTSASGGDAATLYDVTNRCIRAWKGIRGSAVAELSGGLDSAIVAASISDHGPPLIAAFNFHSLDEPGDERRFARPIAAQLGIPLAEIAIPVTPMTSDGIWDMPIGLRPGLGSTSLFHDRQLAGRAKAMGATTLFTGHGGDAVFFQHPAPEIAAEPFCGSFLARIEALIALSGWTGTSFWGCLGENLRGRYRRDNREPRAAVPDFMAHLPTNTPLSRWLEDTMHLPPAKRLQIGALDRARSAFGPSWSGAVMTTIHPLLSQPLVEHVLGLSLRQLTDGRRDRALARAAYAGRLPATTLARHGKGSLRSHFGRTLAASIPFLCDHLLDGRLVAHGLLERHALEVALTPENLMQTDCYSALLGAILVEQWVRVWEERLASIGHASPFHAGAAPAPTTESSHANMRR